MAASSDYHRLADNDEQQEQTGRLVYSVVARGQIVLTECALSHGTAPQITRVLLSKIPQENTSSDVELGEQEPKKTRKSYKYDS